MKKVIKSVFVCLLLFCSCIFTSIYIISGNVEESYKLTTGQELKIDSFMPVTAVYNDVKMSQGSYNRKAGDNFEVELKLFGVIPFTTTNVEIVDDM